MSDETNGAVPDEASAGAKPVVDAANTERDMAAANAEGGAEGAENGDQRSEDELAQEREEKRSRNAERREARQRMREEIEALRAENERLKSVAPKGDDALRAAVDQEVGPEPKESDFPDWFAYQRALAAYDMRRINAERDLKQAVNAQSRQQQQAFEEIAETYEERLDEARKLYSDFDEVVSRKLPPPPEHVAMLLMESEKAGQLAYHLSKNPDRYHALINMSPVQAAREIGRLEGQLRPPRSDPSKAPPPIGALKGAAAPGFDPSKASMEDYVKARQSGAYR